MKKVFIDGDAGTTGLKLRGLLAAHGGVDVIAPLGEAMRKDKGERLRAMGQADAVILCLPDDAARQAVAMVDDRGLDCVIIDASTAHRVDAGWVYGFPELCPGHREKIKSAKRIANVGCYASAMIALIRPLVDGGLIAPKTRLAVSAISGYSGGGKPLIAVMGERKAGRSFAYATGLDHKHMPEVLAHSGLATKPLFTPMVGDFECGMIVQIPLDGEELQGSARQNSRAAIHAAYGAHYAGEAFIRLCDMDGESPLTGEGHLLADALAGKNHMEIAVLGNDATPLAVARLDNLGKGAAGAAVQNLNLALGFDEAMGLA